MPNSNQVIVVVEGRHDISFLKAISTIVHASQPELPDLAHCERSGELVFLISGGVCSPDQAQQLVRLGLPQFHLLDRDVPPETARRQQTVQAINSLPDCIARLTTKRSLENYLHPQVILEVRGIEIEFGDHDDVATLVAQQVLRDREPEANWEDVPHRSKKRLRNTAKKWLSIEAVSRMTLQQLHERDPHGEVIGWLASIAELGRRE